ncbi:DUF4176 domain-containing protein [Bacillus sp. WL1]|uniref:DUF4176 domain-containing protein n=1 Tax=Bacillus TaxID=1386 RepID=UPI000995675E|nr:MULTISPECIES: DUF4176 domain-containing protein [Bacillus]MBP3969142.1 DUF4176 domain-containing protein [Bacillus sp. WL1]OOZ84108.1 hypothetical protein BHL25_22920 [Bacillus cereus]UOB81578.1 DUF4176 domain-containing protein [Bacillus sp. ZJS3]
MKFFPIGSVVKLKDLNQTVMIIGRMIISADKRAFDYVGVLYPVGYLDDEKVLCFNHDKVVDEVHRGYLIILRGK